MKREKLQNFRNLKNCEEKEEKMRYAQLVMGPAGSGKSTYCSSFVKHAEASRKKIHVINLDPAAEHFDYEPTVDIRELIGLDDAMDDEELKFGPNGGLIFCMETLLENMDWLEEQVGGQDEAASDDYYLIDCPGQIELYTHMKIMRKFVDLLQTWNFRLCGIFLMDAHFMVDGATFLSGAMAALSVMVNLEIPHVNILSKIDLLSAPAKKLLDNYLEPDVRDLTSSSNCHAFNAKYQDLTEALGRVLDDYSLVKYFPLDITNEENIADLTLMIDQILQVSEDADVKVVDQGDEDPEEPYTDD